MKATVFVKPNGEQREIYIAHIRPEDRDFFEQHNVKISLEELNDNVNAVYADTGKVTNGEPDELIELSNGRSCKDTLSALREACEKRFAQEGAPASQFPADSERPGIDEIREEMRANGIPEEFVRERAELVWQERNGVQGGEQCN